MRSLGIEEVLSAPRSPWQRAYIERVIGSIRRECIDHLIVFNEASLYRHLKSFVAYYLNYAVRPKGADHQWGKDPLK